MKQRVLWSVVRETTKRRKAVGGMDNATKKALEAGTDVEGVGLESAAGLPDAGENGTGSVLELAPSNPQRLLNVNIHTVVNTA